MDGSSANNEQPLPEKLRMLAKWFDHPNVKALHPAWSDSTEVQDEVVGVAQMLEQLQEWVNAPVGEPPNATDHTRGRIYGYCAAKEQIASILGMSS